MADDDDKEDDLFSHKPRGAAARSTDPGTSHIAAASVDYQSLELMTWCALFELGPMHTVQIGKELGVPRDSISPRMRNLLRKKLVCKHGIDKTDGRPKIIWAVVTKNDLDKAAPLPVSDPNGPLDSAAIAALFAPMPG